ncbi:MAG: hypothetical protein ABIA08_00205 [bacterium]
MSHNLPVWTKSLLNKHNISNVDIFIYLLDFSVIYCNLYLDTIEEENVMIELILTARTRIPRFITDHPSMITIERKKVRGRTVRSLKIQEGTALFGPGGVVDIKMPVSKYFIVGFLERKVLEIRGSGGNLLAQNYLLCKRCFTNTGEIMSSFPSTLVIGKSNVIVKCSTCEDSWNLASI